MDSVQIQVIIYFIGSILSFILLSFILFKQIKINRNSIIKNCLIIIAISEIINTIHKLINFLKNDNNTKKTICKIQKGIGTYSDICTPFMSLIISIEINHLLKYNEFSSFGLCSSYIIYFIGFLIPLIITIIFYLIDSKDSKEFIDKYPCTLNEPFLFYLYVVFWILIILSVYFSISSLKIIKKKKDEHLLLEEEFPSDSSYPDDLKISSKLNNIYKKNLRYPFIIVLIWSIITIIRIIHYICKDKKKETLRNIFIFYAIIYSFRGMIYSFVYFSKNDCFNSNKENNKNIGLFTINDSNYNDARNNTISVDDSRGSLQEIYSI